MKNRVISFILVVIIMIGTIIISIINKPSYIKVENYDAYHNIYQNKVHDVNMIVLRKDNQVTYLLSLSSGVVADIEGSEYSPGVHEVILEGINASYVKVNLMIGDQTDHFYVFYSQDLTDLNHLSWYSFTPILDSLWLIMGVFFMILIGFIIEYKMSLNHKNKPEFQGTNLYERFKRLTMIKKLVIILLVLFHILWPYMGIFIAFSFLIYQSITKIHGIKKKFISLLLVILIFGLSALLFFGSAAFMLPENQRETVELTPSLSLSTEALQLYQRLIDESFYFSIEPIFYSENEDFMIMGLETYSRFISFSGAKIEPDYHYVIKNKSNQYLNNMIMNIYDGAKLIRSFDDIIDNQINSIYLDEQEINNLSIELRGSNQQELLYQSQIITVIYNLEEQERYMYQGGQFILNPTKTYVITTILLHTTFIFALVGVKKFNQTLYKLSMEIF